jgi:S-DNA-T family DNA segregation ATPase FtsK/SpoIIIE
MTSETDNTKELDTLYPKACLIVQSTGNTLISHLQRVLRTGYNRSARLLEAMEADGIVSPCDARGIRRLLVPSSSTRPESRVA